MKQSNSTTAKTGTGTATATVRNNTVSQVFAELNAEGKKNPPPFVAVKDEKGNFVPVTGNGKADPEKFKSPFQLVPLTSLEVEKNFNVREDFGDIDALKESISSFGIWNPLKVRSGKNGKWLIVDGHRRFKALQMIAAEGFEFDGIEVIIEAPEVTEIERTMELLVMNDGKPLTITEQAKVYDRLEKLGLSTQKIATQAGKTAQHIRDCKLFAASTERVQKLVTEGKITASSVINIMRKEGDGKKAEVKVMELLADAEGKGKGKVKQAEVQKATGKVKKDSAGVGTMRDRINELYGLLAIAERDLKYSEYDVITILQWTETGDGNIGKILEGKNQKSAKK